LVLVGFAWFYSSESGLFNGLERRKIKSLSFRLAQASRKRRARSGQQESYITDFRFWQDYSQVSDSRPRLRRFRPDA
jgi:hypothetical protein